MPRAASAAVAALAVVALVTACGVEDPPTSVAKLSAVELERFLVDAEPDGPVYDCEPAARGRWDYVCSFVDERGERMSIDVIVNATQATRSSGVYAADGPAAVAPSAPASAAKQEWLARINELCGWATSQAARVAEPRNLAEFEAYVSTLRRINEHYRRKLAKLPPPPAVGDRETVKAILLHLEEDRRLATKLIRAIRGRNQAAMADFFGRLRAQAAEGNRLLALMGACPAA